jgi:MFS family permease
VRYLIALTVAAAALAGWLFPRAFPVVVLENRITAEEARQRADSFAQANELPAGVRVAVQFRRDDALLTFLDLGGGGRDTIDALVRGRDLAPYRWSVRTMTPRDVHETRVELAPDGRILGFERRLAEADERPALAPGEAEAAARRVLEEWLGEPGERWRLAASSFETRKTSERIDRTYTFERTDRRIATAPIRLDVVIAGDLASAARRYVEIPEGFRRRYSDMRSANELFAVAASVAMVALILAGALTLRHYGRRRMVRWRAPLVVGAVVGALIAASGLNELPTAWYHYDTATSPATFQLLIVAGSLAAGAMMALVVAVTLAAAEVATRVAFPHHLDWWKLWRYRGTREVADRVAGGYALGAVALAYVVVFYLATRHLFGWWVPAELLDDPNLVATPMPWLAGIALSLQAAVWEEALFRALPLSLISLWIGDRPRRNLWLGVGVVATALVFGFAHSDYPSWPAYSRGVEIFLDAVLWGVVFIRFGLIVTVISHFLYNATLFSLFAAGGSALPYRVTAVVMGLALLSPALVVAWKWFQQRGLTSAPDEARLDAWSAPVRAVVEPAEMLPVVHGGLRARRVAAAAIIAGVAAALLVPGRGMRGPEFTATRAEAIATADSILHERGVDPNQWRRLAATRRDTVGPWSDFLRRYDADTLATALATSYAVPVWWEVRYVRTEGALTAREEEWRVRMRPDGVPLDLSHIVPDSAPGATLTQAESRAIAQAAVAGAGIDTGRLVETDMEETARPARLDVTATYRDTTVELPAGAAARVWAYLSGDEAVLVRRGVELPETFVRENRDRQMTRLLFSALSGVMLVSFVVAAAIKVIRRRQPVVAEAGLSRRASLVAGLAFTAVMVASLMNDLPSMMLGYDTAQPWTSYVTTTTLAAAVGAAFFVLLVAGLWMAANALRRRVGVPVVPTYGDGRNGMRDAVLAGAALGAVSATAALLRQAVSAGIPPAPGTSMDQAIPVLSGIIGLPVAVLAVVPAVAMPLLVIAAVTRLTAYRLLLGAGLVLLLAGVMVQPSSGGASPVMLVVSVVGLVAIAAAVMVWGGFSVITWIAAALTAVGLLGIHEVIRASNATDRMAEGLAVVAVVLALLALSRWRRSPAPSESRPDAAPPDGS